MIHDKEYRLSKHSLEKKSLSKQLPFTANYRTNTEEQGEFDFQSYHFIIFKMFSFKKGYKRYKECMAHSKKILTKTLPEEVHMLDFLAKTLD